MKASTLMTLHSNAVKAAQKYEAATPGTQSKRRLEDQWKNAEEKFRSALCNLAQTEKE